MEIILDDGKLILKELPGGETEIRSFVNEINIPSDTECITSYLFH
ncbi:MAG: hypothetical protein R3A12_19190 [Ignavibacteria bacterium]